jgi:hypothetical protein
MGVAMESIWELSAAVYQLEGEWPPGTTDPPASDLLGRLVDLGRRLNIWERALAWRTWHHADVLDGALTQEMIDLDTIYGVSLP